LRFALTRKSNRLVILFHRFRFVQDRREKKGAERLGRSVFSLASRAKRVRAISSTVDEKRNAKARRVSRFLTSLSLLARSAFTNPLSNN
jgi:hypothetical protein